MLPVLQIGPLVLQTPGLILLAGIWIGLWLAERNAYRHQIEPSHLYNLALVAFLSGLLGGRLFYVFSYPSAFAASPGSIFSLNPGLFDVWGAVFTGLVVAFLYGKRKMLSFWSTLDALTPAFASLVIAISLANLSSGNAYGAPAHVAWAIELWGAKRHPSQVYEALAGLAILGIALYWQRSIASGKPHPGLNFLSFLALTAGARLFLETFRGDSVLLPNGWRVAQMGTWLLLAACLWLIHWRKQAPMDETGQNHQPGD